MANSSPTETTWLGTTTDGTLGSNWSDGVPDAADIDVFFPGTTRTSIINFGAIRARGTLTGSTNFANGDTVVLDVKTYTFIDPAAPSADGEVDLGGNLETSLDNLHDAINLVVGGAYGASMTIHPTVTALSNTATALVVAAKDAGTAGDSIVSDVGVNTGDATWGGATLAAGAASGAALGNLETDEDWPGDLNSSGSLAQISFGRFYHGGSGTVYVDAQQGNRFIVASANYTLAASLKMTGDITRSIEIVRGRAAVNWNGLTGSATRIWVEDLRGQSENLLLTGTGTVPELECSGGVVTTNGPAITAYDAIGTDVRHKGGVIGALRVIGSFSLETTDAVTKTYLQGGTLTTLETQEGKTLTEIYVSPSAEFLRRGDGTGRDTYTLFEIGVK